MSKSIKDILIDNSECEFNKDKLSQVANFYIDFIHKNDDHVNFFGSNLIGVYPIRFQSEDTNILIDDIAEIIDFASLKKDLHSNKEIEPSRMISGNPLNHILPWMAHMFYTSKKLSAKDREVGALICVHLMQIKFLTGLDARYFPYRGNEDLALALSEELTKKSLIKKFGSWKALVEYRSENFIDRKGVWYDVVSKYDDDRRVVKFINDVQSRVRKGYGGLTGKFHKLKEQEARIQASKAFSNINGDIALREYELDVNKFRTRIATIVQYPNDLIKQELIDQILGLINTANEKHLKATLLFISENIDGRKKKFDMLPEIEGLTRYIFDFIKKNDLKTDDIIGNMLKFRKKFRSHGTSDPNVIAIKEKMDDILGETLKKISHEGTLSAAKVSVILYLTLRILVIGYYEN